MAKDPISATPGKEATPARRRSARGPVRHGRRAVPLLALLLLAAPITRIHAQEPVEVTGRVVERESGDPLPDAVVRLDGPGMRTVTRSDGTFDFEGVPPGEHVLEVSHIAYGEHQERLQVEAGTPLAIEISVSQTAIELAPLVVDVPSESDRRERAAGARLNEITRDQIVEADRQGLDLARLLTQSVGGLRERRDRARVGTPICIEFRGAARGGGACRSPVVYLDGVRVSFPSMLYGTLDLASLERLEVVPPAEAGARYGSGAWGALIIETRRPPGGRGALPPSLGGGESEDRPRVTWDWSVEADAHAGNRVFGSAFLGNALGLAAGAGLASQCLESAPDDGLTNSCGTMGMVGIGLAAVLLPALGGSVAGRMAGDTPFSRGELVPSLVGSTFALIPGYLLAIDSQADFGAQSVAGLLIAALGAPLMNTIADRLFRQARTP